MIYNVLCIDDLGCASWEAVEYLYTDGKGDIHGYIKRTNMNVKFWTSESDSDEYVGTTYAQQSH